MCQLGSAACEAGVHAVHRGEESARVRLELGPQRSGKSDLCVQMALDLAGTQDVRLNCVYQPQTG